MGMQSGRESIPSDSMVNDKLTSAVTDTRMLSNFICSMTYQSYPDAKLLTLITQIHHQLSIHSRLWLIDGNGFSHEYIHSEEEGEIENCSHTTTGTAQRGCVRSEIQRSAEKSVVLLLFLEERMWSLYSTSRSEWLLNPTEEINVIDQSTSNYTAINKTAPLQGSQYYSKPCLEEAIRITRYACSTRASFPNLQAAEVEKRESVETPVDSSIHPKDNELLSCAQISDSNYDGYITTGAPDGYAMNVIEANNSDQGPRPNGMDVPDRNATDSCIHSENGVENIMFSALGDIPLRFLSKSFMDAGFTEIYNNPCELWQRANPFVKRQNFKLQEGFVFSRSPPEPDDLRLINDTWQFASSTSLSYMRAITNQHPLLTVRCTKDENGDGGKLCAWILLHADGSIGHVYVLPQFRGMGLATAALSAFVNDMEDWYRIREIYGLPVFAFITESNCVSKILFTKLGFVAVRRATWVGYTK